MGVHIYFIYVHSSPFLFVCGDDRITCYPGADVLPAEHQKLYSCSEEDKVWVQMSSALVPDGVSKAEI